MNYNYETIKEPADRIPLTFPGYGKVFRELREYEGLSQREMAKYCCVHKNTVNRWELESGAPSLDIFLTAIKAFGYHLEIVKDGR